MARALQALLQTWFSVAALFCVGLCAHPAAAELVNENLLAGVPSGYKVGFHDKQGNFGDDRVGAGQGDRQQLDRNGDGADITRI